MVNINTEICRKSRENVEKMSRITLGTLTFSPDGPGGIPYPLKTVSWNCLIYYLWTPPLNLWGGTSWEKLISKNRTRAYLGIINWLICLSVCNNIWGRSSVVECLLNMWEVQGSIQHGTQLSLTFSFISMKIHSSRKEMQVSFLLEIAKYNRISLHILWITGKPNEFMVRFFWDSV